MATSSTLDPSRFVTSSSAPSTPRGRRARVRPDPAPVRVRSPPSGIGWRPHAGVHTERRAGGDHARWRANREPLRVRPSVAYATRMPRWMSGTNPAGHHGDAASPGGASSNGGHTPRRPVADAIARRPPDPSAAAARPPAAAVSLPAEPRRRRRPVEGSERLVDPAVRLPGTLPSTILAGPFCRLIDLTVRIASRLLCGHALPHADQASAEALLLRTSK